MCTISHAAVFAITKCLQDGHGGPYIKGLTMKGPGHRRRQESRESRKEKYRKLENGKKGRKDEQETMNYEESGERSRARWRNERRVGNRRKCNPGRRK